MAMAKRDDLMAEISEILNFPAVPKGIGSSVHNDFIDPLADGVLGVELAEVFSDKYRKIQAIIETLGGAYVPSSPDARGSGHTSEGTASGGGGTITNFGLETIRDLLLENGVPAVPGAEQEIVRELLEEGYDPYGIVQERIRKVRAIADRPGATKYRDAVRTAYGNTCCVTGTDEPAALEAAHIAPYAGPPSDTVGNSLLLRADIHKLHDALLLAVSDEDLTVLIKARLRDTTYADLEGVRIREPKGYLVSLESLRFHRQRSGL